MSWTFGGVSDEDIQVPDFAEPLIGYRMWKIGLGDVLQSPAQNTVWEPGQPLKAACRLTFGNSPMNFWFNPSVADLDDGEPICTRCPCDEKEADRHAGYGCGIYSWSDFEYFLEHGYTAAALGWTKKQDIAIGTCWVWGRVVQQEMGWRSEYAAVRTLYSTHSRVRRIASKFGVELESIPRGLTYKGRRK